MIPHSSTSATPSEAGAWAAGSGGRAPKDASALAAAVQVDPGDYQWEGSRVELESGIHLSTSC